MCWRKRCWLKGDGGRSLKAKPVFHVSAILRFPRNNLKRNGRVSRLNVARKRHDDASTKQDLFPPANVCAHVFRRYRGRRIKLSSSYSFEYLLLFLCTRRMGQQGKKKENISLFDKRKDSGSKREGRSKPSNLASLHLINKNKTRYFETRHFHVPLLPLLVCMAPRFLAHTRHCHFRSVV